MYKIVYFVPKEYKEQTKNALFELGVGKFENYECCAFETLGVGQFKPILDAKPFLGELDTIEKVEEYRVEMICQNSLIKKAIEVLKKTHPYEEVAYDVFKLEDF